MNRMSAPTRWYRRLMALAELKGDHTQQDVARTLGVSKSAITNWKGGTRPDPEQVKAAARAYDADALELLWIAYLDCDEPALASAGGRFGYYVARGMFEPYQPLDMSPFETRAIEGRYNLHLTNYVRWGTAELLKRELVERDIGGAVAEVGVGHGDFAWFLNYHFRDRRLYLFDTFSGFDSRDQDSDQQAGLPPEPYKFPAFSAGRVRDLLPYPDTVDFRVGWFPESAVGLEDETFAFVHVDVGLHRPTLAALEWFYPRLAVHGYLLVADYNTSHTPGVRRAVRDFASATRTTFVTLPDWSGTAVLAKV